MAEQLRALAKIKAHKQGGAANSQYIGSLRDEPSREPDRGVEEPSARSEPDELGVEDNRVWGWNVPWFIADDGHGVWETAEGRALLESQSLTLSAQHLGLGPPPETAEKLSGDEKRENLVAHFSAMADLEERRGGLTHFRLILSVGREVSIEQLKALVNAYLRENFPLCPAFVAIHDDTEHRHAHVYVQARQLNGRRIDLGQDYFKLDESWMSICAAQLGDPKIYDVHMELKGQTLGWKKEEKQARANGEVIPPKPDRWGDHHDTLLTFCPFDDRWCGRLQAQTRVAEAKVTWLETTKAQSEEIAAASLEAQRLRERLEATAEKRARSKSESKRRMPAEVITVSEQRELKSYERDILSAEKREAKAAPEPVTTGQTAAQAALPFDEAVAAQGEHLGLNFGIQIEGQRRETAVTQSRQARTGQKSQAHKRARAQSPLAATPSASPSTEETARSLGRELVSEMRLAFYESGSGAARTRKEKQQLKGRLVATREEHAHAQREAEMCRANLASQGAAEPPYRLTGDERNYLKLVSKHLPEFLRERIEREVSRARIITDRLEDSPSQSGKEAISRAGTHRAQDVSEKQIPCTVGEQKYPVASEPQREDSSRQDVAARTTATTERPPEPAVHTLPDDEVRRMIVDFELTKARAVALHAAEKDFNAAPHRWVSPTPKVTLAEVEARIGDGLERSQDVRGLDDLKRRVQDQIAAERVNAPLRRKEADDEARSLKERLTAEAATRGRLGLMMPDAVMTPDELREMMRYAEISRDPELLRTAHEIELGQTLRDANLTGDGSHVRRLEEKYAGVELRAEVSADRHRQFLTAEAKKPEKTLLPALDETGRGIALALEQAGAHKGLRGVISKLVETAAHRRLREQLAETKDAYFRHLRSGVEGREMFRESARAIRLECRERGREFGYHAPAAPELTRAEIQEIRDYAVKQTGANRERWLSACTGAQRLGDERDVAAWQPAKTIEGATTSLASQQRSDLIRKEIETKRAEAEAYQRVKRTVVGHDQQDLHKPRDRNLRGPDSPRGGRSRSR